jgi:hypothetical protein
VIELLDQKEHPVVKGSIQQWWRAGPLSLTLSSDKHGRWNILYNKFTETRKEYTSEDDDYAPFRLICAENDIPFEIIDNGAGQMHFLVPSSHKMAFLEALEVHVAPRNYAIR